MDSGLMVPPSRVPPRVTPPRTPDSMDKVMASEQPSSARILPTRSGTPRPRFTNWPAWISKAQRRAMSLRTSKGAGATSLTGIFSAPHISAR